MLQHRWFTNAADGNTITMASGLGGLIYITTSWVSATQRDAVMLLPPMCADCGARAFACTTAGPSMPQSVNWSTCML